MTTGSHQSPPDNALWIQALMATLMMQTLVAFQTRMFPLLGPSLVEAAQIPSAAIGYLVALHSAGTVWFLVAAGDWLPRLGPLRSLQVGVVLGVVGLLLALPGAWWFLVVAALVIGIGYGPSTTAGSEVLMRYAPSQHRALVFSLKQSGVPLGGAISGAALPALIDMAGWRAASVLCALLMLAATFAIQPLRAPIDQHREQGRPASWLCLFDPRMIYRPFLAMRADPSLRSITAGVFCFASAQGVLFAFFVLYAMEQGGLSLIAAGLAFSNMQITSILGRLAAGWAADRLRMPRLVLVGLGTGATLALVGIALIDASWSLLQIHTVAALAGATATSWNGVFLSELGRLSKPHQIGETTAAGTFFIFIGYVAGPAIFGWAVLQGVSYRTAFLVIGMVVAIGVATLAASLRPRSVSS
jgi:MFS family permease